MTFQAKSHREWLQEQLDKSADELNKVRQVKFSKGMLLSIAMSWIWVYAVGRELGTVGAIATSTVAIILGIYVVWMIREGRRERIRVAVIEFDEAKKALDEAEEE